MHRDGNRPVDAGHSQPNDETTARCDAVVSPPIPSRPARSGSIAILKDRSFAPADTEADGYDYLSGLMEAT
jgi:hypothetical protein